MTAADDLDRTNFLVFAFVGFILVLAQGFYRPFATRVGEIRFMRIGMAVMSVGLALAGAVAWMAHRGSVDHGSSILWYSLPVLAITVVGYAFLTPSLQALISKRSDPARQGEILGVNQSAAAMSRILGPVVWLAMYHMQAAHVLPYVFGAILLGVVFLATLRIR